MIITSIEDLRITCSDVLPEEVGPLREALERELNNSIANGSHGIGLAAPQIGVPKKMAIVRLGSNGEYNLNVDLVNCQITAGYDKAIFESEGCLSFPGKYERTSRFQEIHIIDNMIFPNSFIAKGLFAVAIQHELDHLSGILLPDIAIPKEHVVSGKKIKPNDICFCGSGKKYKKCHFNI